MSETTNKARALIAAATPGPWQECGSARGGCDCGNVWSVTSDVPVASATRKWEGGEFSAAQMNANAAIIAAAPTLIATLCAEADASERDAADARRVVESSIQSVHAANERADASERRAVEAEASAAVGMKAVRLLMEAHAGDEPDSRCEACSAGIDAIMGSKHRGDFLDRLEQAEAERDANRTAAENAYAAQLAAESERDALRKACVRLADAWGDASPAAEVYTADIGAEYPERDRDLRDALLVCVAASLSGSGAVIVEGETT